MKHSEKNVFYLHTPNETKSIKFEVEFPQCDIPSILLINSNCVENCIGTSDPNAGNPVMQDQQGIIDPILIKALTLFLDIPEGQAAFGLFMDTGQSITLGDKTVYTASCQGDFYNRHALHFIESNNLDSGNAMAVTESKYLGRRCSEDNINPAIWHATKGIGTSTYYNDVLRIQRRSKYLYMKLIIRIHMKHYNAVQKANQWDDQRCAMQMCFTIAHEFFIHAYRKSIPAMKAWNTEDFESYDKIIQRDTGHSGDYDHAAYIQDYQDEGLRLMEAFKHSLKKQIGTTIFKDILQKHDAKYKNLKHKKIPTKGTNHTEY